MGYPISLCLRRCHVHYAFFEILSISFSPSTSTSRASVHSGQWIMRYPASSLSSCAADAYTLLRIAQSYRYSRSYYFIQSHTSPQISPLHLHLYIRPPARLSPTSLPPPQNLPSSIFHKAPNLQGNHHHHHHHHLAHIDIKIAENFNARILPIPPITERRTPNAEPRGSFAQQRACEGSCLCTIFVEREADADAVQKRGMVWRCNR